MKAIFKMVIGCLIVFCQAYGEEPNQETKLALVMVVDKDAANLRETLESVKQLVDYVSIYDRGSAQETQDIVSTFLDKYGIPGKVGGDENTSNEFIDLDSAAIAIAKKRLEEAGFSLNHTFLLILKPNQRLNTPTTFRKDLLKKDAYLVREKSSEHSSYQGHLLRASLPWKKKGGTIYGYWTLAEEPHDSSEVLRNWLIHDQRERRSDEIERDLELVTAALKDDPQNKRLLFDFARLNQLQHRYEEAITAYQERIARGGNSEEVWCSKQMMGECHEALGKWESALANYLDAYQNNLNRAEPLYRIAHHYRSQNDANLAHFFATKGATITYPSHEHLWIHDAVYDHLLDQEISIASYYTPFKQDGLKATHQLMLKNQLPTHIKDNAIRNILFYVQKLPNVRYLPLAQEESLNESASDHAYTPMIVGGSHGYNHEPYYEFSRFRSASPPVPWGDGQLMLVYETVWLDQKKHHIHRFLTLDKQNIIKSLSKPFFFKQLGDEQCGKLSVNLDKRKLQIPVTFEKIAFLASLDFHSVQPLLEPLSATSGRYQVILPKGEEFNKLKEDLIQIVATEKDDQNPFAISFPRKENLTNEDYEVMQKEMRKVDVLPYLKTLYETPEVDPKNYTSFADFENRLTKGYKQVLIDVENNLLPIQKLEKIGLGSDMCIVSYSSYNKHYPDLVKSIPEALRETGFNGYVYYRLGGYPNATGLEAGFAAVPYAWKIFMMVEAYQMGFSKVIWLDSAVVPLNDPTPLFDILNADESYFYGYIGNQCGAYVLPATLKVFKDLTGTDILTQNHVYGPIIGLKMNAKIVHDFIKSFYKLVAKGTPFMSCAADEFVYTAILGQPGYERLQAPFRHKLLHYSVWGQEDALHLAKIKKEGFYFYHRTH